MIEGEAILAPRPFASEADVRAVARGLLARTLPRPMWTHEAHLGAIIAILVEHSEVDPDADMRDIISGYNAAVGGVNDDTQGYHDTMTHAWIAIARAHTAANPGLPLLDLANGLICGPDGDRDAPLRHYSHGRLFSVEARRAFIAPDLAPLPVVS
jgi:hypothetical protein